MKKVDIVEVITECIKKKIIGEWKHEGYMYGKSCDQVSFIIDGQVYVISIEAESNIEKLLNPYSKGK